MNRKALNKFNAPEMLGALFTALDVAGLGDVVDELRKKKVPQLIEQAWRNREKTALDVGVRSLVQRVADRHLKARRMSQ